MFKDAFADLNNCSVYSMFFTFEVEMVFNKHSILMQFYYKMPNKYENLNFIFNPYL